MQNGAGQKSRSTQMCTPTPAGHQHLHLAHPTRQGCFLNKPTTKTEKIAPVSEHLSAACHSLYSISSEKEKKAERDGMEKKRVRVHR